MVEVNDSWVTYIDSAELAFFSEDVCLEGCKYSKMYLFITRVFLLYPLNLPCLAAPTYPLYDHFFIS